jgi:ABC-type Mn2+/Zn2+ transport system ATPase subunit
LYHPRHPVHQILEVPLNTAAYYLQDVVFELVPLDFLKDATNAILVGPNGVGKSTLARNS